MTKWIADTNFVYNGLQETLGQYDIVLVSTVKQELDKHKTAVSEELKFQARQANRFIFENYDSFEHITKEYDPTKILGEEYSRDVMDNRIVACAVANGYGILTNDLNMYSTARDFGLPVASYNESQVVETYQGFTEVKTTSSEIIEFNITSLEENKYNLLTNEYLILRDENGNVEPFVWTGEFHESINPNLKFKSKSIDDFVPRDVYQLILVDSIIRNTFTMITARAGSGKTQSALTYAMQEIESGREYDRIIVITNNLPASGAFYNGWVKGTLLEKLLDSTIGNILGSKLGDKDLVVEMIADNKLEIMPLSDVRGWEAKENSIVIITEGQNFHRDSLMLAIQRLPENCKLIVEGDNKTQLDDKSFAGRNNGMTIASEVFRGQDYYGQVELQYIYRSKLAEQAELMRTQ